MGAWFKPRIGHLVHHEPRPLRVPASHVATTAPPQPPRISLVTPSFEQGEFLERTLYSVVTQQYPELEYVVQDGGSTDASVDVLRRFEPVLSLWRSEPDAGHAQALNRGFAATSGDVMGWLNADDLLLPGALAYVAQYFVTHPQVDVVYGNRILIDELDRAIGVWVLPQHDDEVLAIGDYVPQETLFWRRRIWEAAGSHVDEDLRYAIDWELLLRFRDAGATIVHLPRYLGAFRVHDRQTSTAAREVGEAECALLRERVHGRSISAEEVLRRLRPYLVRHLLVHARQRVRDRFSHLVQVQTVPPEEWLRALESSGSGAASRAVGR